MRIKLLAAFSIGVMLVSGVHAQDQVAGVQATTQDSLNVITVDYSKSIQTPFAATNKKLTTGAITAINPEDLLSFDNVHNVNDMLAGRVPGSLGGLDIRGLGAALVVIDGFPRPVASVNINEIEQITVIKDASAAILYGVQAKNGVILITTKRGQLNKKIIKTTLEYGFGKPVSYPDYLGAADYMQLYNEARANDGLPGLYSQAAIDATRSGANPTKYPDINYFTPEFLRSSKPTSRIITEFSGGNESARYYVNLGWLRSGSILNMGEGKKQHTDRLNMRSNLNFRLSNAIQSSLDIIGIFDINKMASGNFFSDVTTLNPNYYPGLIDSSLITDKNILKTATFVNGMVLGGTSVYKNNVYGNLNLGGYRNQMNTSVQFTNGFTVDLARIVSGLSFKTKVGFDFYNQFTEFQTNTYAVYEPRWTVNANNEDVLSLTRIGVDKFSGTLGVNNTNLKRRSNFYGMLDYASNFSDKHQLNASMVYYFDKFNETDIFFTTRSTHLGTRVNYAYDNKYLLDFNSAFVYSTRLPAGNRIGMSPALGLGWVISEEDFLSNSSVVDFLKLRASASVLNTDLNLFRYYAYENIYNYGGSFTWGDGTRTNRSTILTNLGNPNLFYEKRKEINLGADAMLFNKSLSVEASVFMGRNSDLVAFRNNSYPAYLGGINPLENYGEEKYTGVELGIAWNKSFNDFNIQVGASMTAMKADVVKRDEMWAYEYLERAGKATSATFGLEALGFFKDAQDIAAHPVQSFGAVQPGDIKYKDQNNDGKVDAEDEIVLGKGMADFTGGLTVKLQYRNLSLFTLITTNQGGKRYYNNSYYQVFGDRKFSSVVWNRWTPATAATASYPRLTSRANNNNFRQSSFWLYDNSSVNISRVQLSYELTPSVASRLKTTAFGLFVRASNLATFAKNRQMMQLSIGSEPQYRFYSAGVKATF
jgi:TonB-linked SusC/RagA family outer membrane protein